MFISFLVLQLFSSKVVIVVVIVLRFENIKLIKILNDYTNIIVKGDTGKVGKTNKQPIEKKKPCCEQLVIINIFQYINSNIIVVQYPPYHHY